MGKITVEDRAQAITDFLVDSALKAAEVAARGIKITMQPMTMEEFKEEMERRSSEEHIDIEVYEDHVEVAETPAEKAVKTRKNKKPKDFKKQLALQTAGIKAARTKKSKTTDKEALLVSALKDADKNGLTSTQCLKATKWDPRVDGKRDAFNKWMKKMSKKGICIELETEIVGSDGRRCRNMRWHSRASTRGSKG